MNLFRRKIELYSTSGFTLVEILVALLILNIVVISFTALFTASYSDIFAAGRKSLSLYQAQKIIENRIALEDISNPHKLEIVFNDGPAISVEGGIVNVSSDREGSVSTMTAFVAFVPSISIEPSELTRGYDIPIDINVIGTRTHFDEDHTNITIYDKNNFSIIGTYSLKDVMDQEHAVIELDALLNSELSPYKIEMTTGDETVSAYLTITPSQE